jgi:hypothetical protein
MNAMTYYHQTIPNGRFSRHWHHIQWTNANQSKGSVNFSDSNPEQRSYGALHITATGQSSGLCTNDWQAAKRFALTGHI